MVLDQLSARQGIRHVCGHEAAACYCFNKNLELQDDDAESPYTKRHGKQFTGTMLPCGSAVRFKPAPTKENYHKKLNPTEYEEYS